VKYLHSKLGFFFICIFSVVFIFTILHAQTLKRHIIGSGGTLNLSAADSLFMRGKYQEVEKYLDWQINNDPENPVLLFNKGLFSDIFRRGDELEWLVKAYKYAPDSPYINYYLGRAYATQNNLNQAIIHLEKAVAKEKDYYQAEVELGRTLRLLGQIDKAIPHLEHSIEQGRNYPYAYIELANALRTAGDQEQALSILQEGCERFPFEQLLYEIIQFFLHSATPDSAIVYAEKYLEFYPKGPRLGRITKLLQDSNPTIMTNNNQEYPDLLSPQVGKTFSPVRVLPIGQRTTYQAKWGFLNLGNFEIDVMEGEWHGKPSWRIQYIVRTNPALPFISVVDTLRAHISRDIRNSYCLELRYFEKNYVACERFEFDYDSGYMVVKEVQGDGHWLYEKHPLPPNVFDALSMTWIAQQCIIAGKSAVFHTGISAGYELTRFDVLDKDKNLKLAGKTWTTIKADGKMNYAGIVGLTGEYVAWFSDDGKGLPLMAKFKIFIGHVTLKLVSIRNLSESEKLKW